MTIRVSPSIARIEYWSEDLTQKASDAAGHDVRGTNCSLSASHNNRFPPIDPPHACVCSVRNNVCDYRLRGDVFASTIVSIYVLCCNMYNRRTH